MEPTKEQQDEIYRQKILAARRMTPEERVLESMRQSDAALQKMLEDVRKQYPDACEGEALEILRGRIEILRWQKGKRRYYVPSDDSGDA